MPDIEDRIAGAPSCTLLKVLAILLVSCTLASCIPAPRTEFMGPNGHMIYAVGCSGWGRTMDDCKNEARELCPGGQGTISLASGANDVSAQGGIGDQPAQKLKFECKSP